MKRLMMILPVLMVTLAVGVIIYRGEGAAENLEVDGGMNQAGQEDSAAASQYDVPDDIYYTEPVASVVFSHDAHAGGLGFSCDTCHSGLFEMDALSVQGEPDFNMQGLARGKYCGACHASGSKTAFASDTQCARCHVGVTGLERLDDSSNEH